MKVVIDTNVIFSGIFFGGVPDRILDLALDGKYRLVVSEDIISEYQSVIIRYCKNKNVEDISEPLNVVDLLKSNAEFVDTLNIPSPYCADSDDAKFLRAAIAAEARYLVSEDKHLLDVKYYPGGFVVKPQEFLQLI